MTFGNSVTSIGSYAFSGCTGLNSIAIGNSVTSIGNYAFSNCNNLASVTIPNSVTSINAYAFNKCSSLTSISIPSSVTYIGNNAFNSCSSLTAVHISDLAAWCGISFNSSNPLQVAQHLYLNGEEITSLTIPSSITAIKDYAFYGWTSLTSVTIPNSVTSIGMYAFSRCKGLTSIAIGNSVTKIDKYAFTNCTGLASVTIPNSVTSIGSYAFEGCSGLTAVHISDLAAWCRISFNSSASANPLYMAQHLYLNGEEVTSLTIPSSITAIKAYAFYGWTALTSLTIPNSVTTIGNYSFYNCSGLTEVIVERQTPASNNHLSFAYTATLYVPSTAVTSYSSKSYWSNFAEIKPISLSLDYSSTGMYVGDAQALVATVDPTSYASRLTWESSDTNVATVGSDGTVTAVSAGTATITASLPSGATATCVVVVLTEPQYALDGDITAETISTLNDFFTNTELYSIDLTSATSIADGIEIPTNGNCIIYVPAGTILANTDNVAIGGVCDNLVITDGKPFAAPTPFTATTATYERSNLSNAWGTVCLPYAVESNDDVTYYTTGTINGDVLTLTSVDEVPAGTPAIFKANSSTLSANATNVNVVTTVQGESVTTDEITLVGSFEKTVIDDVKTDAANEYYYINSGQFWHATKKLTINPFRAYFTVPKSAAPSSGFSIAVGEDDVTALSALTGEGDITIVGIYCIDGKPQSDLQPGLNIVKLSNGKTKKILIK